MLLNRSKIVLNIMRQLWDDPVFRLLQASANGCMLLSETVLPTSCGPFQPDVHFVTADLNDLVDAIRHNLGDPDRRDEITERAHHDVSTSLTMREMVARYLLNNLGDNLGETSEV